MGNCCGLGSKGQAYAVAEPFPGDKNEKADIIIRAPRPVSPPKVTVDERKKCRVLKCEEDHQRHYCRVCRNTDSDHFSRMCKKAKCKASSCKESHNRHYCRICDNQDSDHLASECLIGEDLFHVTSTENVPLIIKNGFLPSSQGRLGQGIYFAKSKKVVENIGKNRVVNSYPKGYSILTCRVNTGKKKTVKDSSNDFQGKWKKQGFDSVQGIHPPWVGNGQFPQICIDNKKRIYILEINIVSGEVDQQIMIKNCNFVVSEKAKFDSTKSTVIKTIDREILLRRKDNGNLDASTNDENL